MADGFLNRWARRKAGEHIEPNPNPEPKAELSGSPEIKDPLPDSAELPAPMTMEDVEKIDKFASDFSGFMQPGVDPSVQQAALKKMFSDPRFNVMDGLDIYIDDYSKPDPIPLEMLKRMVQSDMLNIFRKDVDSAPLPDLTAIQTNTGGAEPAVLNAGEHSLSPDHQTDLTSSHSNPEPVAKDGPPIVWDKKPT